MQRDSVGDIVCFGRLPKGRMVLRERLEGDHARRGHGMSETDSIVAVGGADIDDAFVAVGNDRLNRRVQLQFLRTEEVGEMVAIGSGAEMKGHIFERSSHDATTGCALDHHGGHLPSWESSPTHRDT